MIRVSAVVATAILAALPKCPLCIAAYVALGIGLGTSIATAVHLRLLLIVLCASWLVFYLLRHARKILVHGVGRGNCQESGLMRFKRPDLQ